MLQRSLLILFFLVRVRGRFSLSRAVLAFIFFTHAFLCVFPEHVEASWNVDFAYRSEWKHVLFFKRGWFTEKSLVQDPKFFLNPDGATNPQAEALAIVRALEEESPTVPEQNSVHCRFPARVALVRKFAAEFGKIIPSRVCEELDQFLRATDPVSVSMVFSSYYPNNPSSLFGHTFLRFSKRSGSNISSSSLNDLSVSFTAHPDTFNPLLYVYRGLMGGFPGHFDVLPYYMKVQEYNNSESRDIWEYRLNVPEPGLRLLLLSLWEIRNSYIPYYYLDNNCSYILLKLLEIARPELDVSSKFSTFVIPGETLLEIVNTNDLVKEVQYRPSVFKRFLSMYQDLSVGEKNFLSQLLFQNSVIDRLKYSSVAEQVRILDTLLEYIEFDERLAGSKESVKWKSLRHEALLRRAALGTLDQKQLIVKESFEAAKISEEENPSKTHPASRVGMWGGTSLREPFVDFNWRPALHDLASRRAGYSKQLEIGFFELTWRWWFSRSNSYPLPQLWHWSLLHILSANAAPKIVSKPAWLFDLEWSRDNPNQSARTLLRLGYGKGAEAKWANAYALGVSEAHYDLAMGPRVGVGLITGVIAHVSTMMRFRLDVQEQYYFGKTSAWEWKASATISHDLPANYESRLAFEVDNHHREIRLGLFKLF